MEHWIPVLWVVVAIAMLLFLTVKVKLHSMITLLIIAIFVAFMEGMDPTTLVKTITKGAGSTLGGVGMIVVLGAALGQLMTDCGASKKIADTIVKHCGERTLKWGMLAVGVVFGISMFFEVAFMVVVPLVVSIAKEAKIPYMFLIIPVLAAVAQAHSIFPPQPGPMALVDAFGADSGLVYLLGLVVVIPSIICAGIILPKFLKGIDTYAAPKLGNLSSVDTSMFKLPPFIICLLIPLLPAVFMIGNTIVSGVCDKTGIVAQAFNFFGSPNVSLLAAVLVAIYVFGIRAGRTVDETSSSITAAIKGISTVVLIIGAGGVFKQVIVDAGVGQHIAAAVTGMSISPLILAWMITVVIRWATGQGAVSAITAAGIVAPLIPVFNVDPTLLMLATAASSNTITMPNDAAFWMMKETFNLSIGQTFKTWGLLELVNSVVGLGVVLTLSLFI
jgi:high-affinity gluconate transporter